jgi:hypothetical protein
LNPPRGWTLDDRRSRPPLFLDDARRAAPVNASAAETEDDDVDRGSTARQLFFGQSA